MIKGSCLCGAIEFEVEPIEDKIYNCHCSECRKSHGAAFATQMFAKGDTLSFIKGVEHLKEYIGHGGVRAFCSNCGSRLMNYAPDKKMYFSVALACVDSVFTGKPIAHAFVGSKASWYTPSTDIPSFAEMPEKVFD